MPPTDHTDETKRDWRHRAVVGVVLLALLVGGAWLLTSGGAQSSSPYNVTAGSEGVAYSANDGPTILLHENLTNTTIQHPFPDNQTIQFYAGVRVWSDGPTEANLTGLEANWTTVTAMDVQDNRLHLDTGGKQNVSVQGDTRRLEYQDVTLDDGAADFRYGGPDGGTTRLTIEDIPTGTPVLARNASGVLLDWGEPAADGDLALALPQSDHDVQLASAGSPQIDNSSATPTGNHSTAPDEFAVDVSHPDMDDTSVEVAFYYEGEQFATDTLETNGTARATVPEDIVMGSQDWHVVATDDFGQSTTSSTYSFRILPEIPIVPEQSPDSDSSVSTIVDFYVGDTVYTRGTSYDGDVEAYVVNTSGIAADDPLVAVVRDGASQWELPRQVFVDRLDEQRAFYIHDNNAADWVEVVLEVEDYSGDFPAEDSALSLERSLQGGFRAVTGDLIGATSEVTVRVEEGARYQLVLHNTETGERRVVGSFSPTSAGTRTVRVLEDRVVVEPTGASISVEPQTRTLPATDTASVTVAVDENDDELANWTVNVTAELDNGSTEVLHQETVQGPDGGQISPTFNLSGRHNQTVIVDVAVTDANGTTIQQRRSYRVSEFFEHDNSLWSVLAGTGGVLGIGSGGLALLAAVLTVLITGGVASTIATSTETVGATALGCVVVFALIGWLSWQLAFAAGVTFAALWTVRRGV